MVIIRVLKERSFEMNDVTYVIENCKKLTENLNAINKKTENAFKLLDCLDEKLRENSDKIMRKGEIMAYTKLKELIEKGIVTINDLKRVRDAMTSNGSTYGLLDTSIRDFEKDIQTKELLKECKKMLMSSNYQNMTQYHEVLGLRDRINKILGEE